MIYKTCPRCKVKLKRTQMVKQKLSAFGGKNKIDVWFCTKHLNEESVIKAIWRDSIKNIIPESVFLLTDVFEKIFPTRRGQ